LSTTGPSIFAFGSSTQTISSVLTIFSAIRKTSFVVSF
jgi:hypothetical protein